MVLAGDDGAAPTASATRKSTLTWKNPTTAPKIAPAMRSKVNVASRASRSEKTPPMISKTIVTTAVTTTNDHALAKMSPLCTSDAK